jgi:hypothetical protein
MSLVLHIFTFRFIVLVRTSRSPAYAGILSLFDQDFVMIRPQLLLQDDLHDLQR